MKSESVDKLSKILYPAFLGFVFGGAIRHQLPKAFPFILLSTVLLLAVLALVYVYLREREIKIIGVDCASGDDYSAEIWGEYSNGIFRVTHITHNRQPNKSLQGTLDSAILDSSEATE